MLRQRHGAASDPSDIRLSYGGTPLLDGAELHVEESERLCLVGRNGSGKSTLLKLAAGLIEPDSGERSHSGNHDPLSAAGTGFFRIRDGR